ncbi:hypothetical protein OIU80_15415 [Flavobacterium sp. LS1R47]|uniref:Serine endopeptidase n=1 Tax=Flavobacterium frigoritolerans TaxID=2987686 RepID=A0A9X3C266_9FLAO|nr:hypothetical protein [Flavobacterium frigoritolerans]MCV9933671.1 hypothetical protein [Flavobacterium frigoritolerans]
MKKSPLTLNDFKKNELPKKHYKMITGGEDPKNGTTAPSETDPPGTVKPPGQS